MNRFLSLERAPAETRAILRKRFARYLPSRRYESYRTDQKNVIDDEQLLYLLLNLSIEAGSDVEKAKATYLESYHADSGEPSFEELIADGWVRVIWGRISISSGIARSIPARSMAAFNSLLARRFDEKYLLTSEAKNNPKLAGIIAAIDSRDDYSRLVVPDILSCQSPEWVVARLWDRTFNKSPDITGTLRIWVDRRRLLMYPSFQPGRVWSETAVKAFRKAVLNLLEIEPGIMKWNQMRSHCLNQTALINGQPLSNFEGYIPPIPATLVSRVLWLEDRRCEHYVTTMLSDECVDIFGLVSLVLSDVEAEESGLLPSKVINKLVKLSIDRPELLHPDFPST